MKGLPFISIAYYSFKNRSENFDCNHFVTAIEKSLKVWELFEEPYQISQICQSAKAIFLPSLSILFAFQRDRGTKLLKLFLLCYITVTF